MARVNCNPLLSTAGVVVCSVFSHAAAAADTAPAPTELPEISVIATTPVGTTSISEDKYPGNVQIINHKDMPPNAHSLPDVLDQTVGSVTVNNTQGNPYVVDLNYRGFTASPVLGTPQGISVFMDGMRVNEPFGDVVSWDLIPQIAIANITMVPGSNPVFGLNTLGGAVAINTKSGFAFPGGDAKVTLGSYGRRSLDAEYGGHRDNTDFYVATTIYNDRGWGQYNPSQVRQFFGKAGYQNERADLDFTLMYADNFLNGNQNVPLSTLDNPAAGYSHPDYNDTQSYTLNLRGSFQFSDEKSMGGNVYYRHINRNVLNSNIGDPVSTSTNDPTCTLTANCPASNLLAHYTQDVYGANLQWSNTAKLFGKPQVMTLGVNAEYGKTNFSNVGQNAYVDNTGGTIGVDAFVPQAGVSSTNRRYGVFATDTINPNERLAVTVSARYDHATVGLSGTSCSDANALCDSNATVTTVPGTDTLTNVTGSHSYSRLNPSLGAAYQFTPQVTGFANYAEGFRTPSAIELACADPNSPCTGIPNAFGADPDLKAVVSKTYEAGLRGKFSEALRWRAAVYRSTLYDDILFNQTNAVQGYFSNVGKTRRQGVELALDGTRGKFDYAIAASYIDATFESPFTLANGSNSVCIAANGAGGGCAGVLAQPGDKIPGIPALTLKLRAGYALTPKTRILASVQAQGSQYARGDENNQDVNGKVPGFATVKVDLDHRFDKKFEVFGGVTNLFNARYATYGTLGANNLTTGNAEQFRGIAAPRSFYTGLRAVF